MAFVVLEILFLPCFILLAVQLGKRRRILQAEKMEAAMVCSRRRPAQPIGDLPSRTFLS